MVRVTVKLGGSLRHRAADPREGVETLLLPQGSRITDLLSHMGIQAAEAKIVLHNARPARLDALLADGDRVALFPPELAFNMYVALLLARKEE